MNQLVEKSLSAPRGPLCCVSVMKTLAWNISIHGPFIVISIGVGVETGSALVPDEACCWRASIMLCGCICSIMSVMPGIPAMSVPSGC